jgi:hypothetical protein
MFIVKGQLVIFLLAILPFTCSDNKNKYASAAFGEWHWNEIG